jgi:hypothetical protein
MAVSWTIVGACDLSCSRLTTYLSQPTAVLSRSLEVWVGLTLLRTEHRVSNSVILLRECQQQQQQQQHRQQHSPPWSRPQSSAVETANVAHPRGIDLHAATKD